MPVGPLRSLAKSCGWEAKLGEGKGLLNGKFIFKTLPDGSLDRTKVICRYCQLNCVIAGVR